MNNNNRNGLLGLALLLMLGAARPAPGLESDAKQPITIDADTATYDEAAGVSIYSGNVLSVQGSLRVNSDKLVVHLQGDEPVKLVFTGKPARFRQTPDTNDEIVGEAMTGEYYPKKNLLELIGNAIVKQGNVTYASDFIQYDIKNSVVRAGEKSSDSKRVRVILKPKAE